MNEDLLRKTIQKILQESEQFKTIVKVRGGGKGGGSPHVIVPRKPLMGFGKSDVMRDNPDPDPETKNKEPIKISKAFLEDDENKYDEILEKLEDTGKLLEKILRNL